ncbi:MAG: hypothetical protein ABSC03_15490 [Verrucomicrobiota bacterium]|jgi:hypothetical protein
MPHRVQESTRTSFVDFIYAVVVGSTFPFLAPFDASFRLIGLLFLIIVILEDFYLFHTQIAGKVSDAPTSFWALVLELLILVLWYLAVLSFPLSSRPFLLALALFYFFKWLAGVAHNAKLASSTVGISTVARLFSFRSSPRLSWLCGSAVGN